MDQELSGQTFGRYHILERLGEGGMALVYKAYDTRLEREVALKVIRTGKAADELFLKRLEREARALAQLSHPNIVHSNDCGEQDGVPYLVMDHLPGGTLKDLIQGPMEYRKAARLLLLAWCLIPGMGTDLFQAAALILSGTGLILFTINHVQVFQKHLDAN